MNKIRSLLFLFSTLVFSLSAQQIELDGIITVHNSKYKTGKIEPVQNADISAPFTTPTASDNDGNFELVFVGMDGGTAVEVSVEKTNLEVVNKNEIFNVVIKRNAPLRISMAPKNQIAQARVEFYDISKKALYARHDRIIANLQKEGAERDALVVQLQTDLNLKDKGVAEIISTLETQLKEAEKKLPEFAKEMAQKNLDYASEEFIKVYELFQQGKIDQALVTLEDAKLDEKISKALNRIEEVKEDISTSQEILSISEEEVRQHIDSKVLQGDLLLLSFQFIDAEDIYEGILKISENFDLNPDIEIKVMRNLLYTYFFTNSREDVNILETKILNLLNSKKEKILIDEIIAIYGHLAQLSLLFGEYEKGILYTEKSIELAEAIDKGYPGLGLFYIQMSMIYYSHKNDLETAFKYNIKALEYYNKNAPKDESIPMVYLHSATLSSAYGEFDDCIKNCKLAVEFYKKFAPKNIGISTAYERLAVAFSNKSMFNKSIEYLVKAMDFLEKNYPNSPAIGTICFSLSNVYTLTGKRGDLDKAVEFALKSKIFYESFGPENIYLGRAYFHLGEANKLKGNFSKAIEYYDKAILIIGKTNPGLDFITKAYIGLSNCYQYQNSFVKSLEYMKKAVQHSEKYNPKSETMCTAYTSYAFLSHLIGDSEKAIDYHSKAIKILESTNKEHPNLHIYYSNIAQTYYFSGDNDNASKYSSKAIEIAQNHDLYTLTLIYAYEIYGASLMNKGKPKEGLENLIKARDFVTKDSLDKKSHTILWNSLAMCYMHLNQPIKAGSYCKLLLDLLPSPDPTLLMTLGRIQRYKNNKKGYQENYQKALNIFYSHLKSQPNNPTVIAYIGTCDYHLKNYTSSLENIEKTEILVDQNAVNQFTGWTTEIKVLNLSKLGQFKKAEKVFVEFEKLEASGSILSKSKAVFYALKGDNSNANKYLQYAVDAGFTDYYWIETEEGLENIRGTKKYKEIIAKLKSN